MDIKTYVINLARRKDRLTELIIPFDYEVFEATDGYELYKDTDYTNNKKGHLGCLTSHKRLLTKIYESDLDYCLVFEDDVDLCDDFLEKLKQVIKEAPEDWDLIYLGGWNVNDKIQYSEHLDIAEKVYTTHSYLVRRKFIPKLLTELDQMNSYKVDVAFSNIQKDNNCFIASPVLGWQRPGFSDIVNKVTNNTHLL
jgi:GR25 family glycosyltransferase involved in LPS biosynthesis